MKIALYYSGSSLLANEAEGWIENDKSYVRATEIVDVEFPPLADEDVLEGRLDALDNRIETVRAEFTSRLDSLEDQKQRLLAITYDGDV